MNKYKLWVLPILFVLFFVLGCDHDNSTIAQEPIPQEPIPMTCPCFTKDDLTNTLMGSGDDITCSIGGVGFTLDPGGPLGGLVEVGCKPNTEDCECRFEDTFHDNLNFFETEDCLNIMFDVLVDFEKEGLSFGGCSFNIIVPDCN